MEAAVNSMAEALPSEILEIIFSYCTHKDLVHSIQNVCLRWREVVQITRVWNNVVYRPKENATLEQVVEMLKISPRLQNIILPEECDVRVLQAIPENCPELRKLEISRPGVFGLDLNFIKNLKKNCPKVQHLGIPHSVMTHLNKCKVVVEFTALKVLRLTGDPNTLLPINLKLVADCCKLLEHLEFQNIRFEMNDLRHLLFMRKGTLHTLGVCCCNESGECVLPAVSTCELKSLSLFSYCYCQRHYEKIECFGRLKTVRALAIEQFYCKDSYYLKQIFENANMAQLVELTLADSPYFEEYLTEVIIKNCPLLKYLALIMCEWVTDASLEIMPNLKELNSLYLEHCSRVTDTGIFHLKDIQGLNYLRFKYCVAVRFGNIANVSTLRDLILGWQDLAEFPWDLIPCHMKYLRYLRIHYCRNVDICAIEKLKRDLPCLKVEVENIL